MVTKLAYYLFILPISYLPFSLLYLISDFLRFVIFQLIGYRKGVIRNNLKNSFPNKSSAELKKIEKEFQKHLCDVVLESFKAFSISLDQAKLRMKDKNVEVLNKYHGSNRPIVLVGGHYGNWELFAITISDSCKMPALALYTPLKNKFMNSKVTASRSKYGLKMLSIKEIKASISELGKHNSAIIFGSDQSPRKHQKAYWMQFLNQATAVQFGAEKFARDFDAIVIFASINKTKRGHYEIRYRLISDDVKQLPLGYISQAHTKMLEIEINTEPAYWLWSHKRWKLSKPEDVALNEPLDIKLNA